MGNLCNQPKQKASDDNKYKPQQHQEKEKPVARLPTGQDDDMNESYSFVGETETEAFQRYLNKGKLPKKKHPGKKPKPTPMIKYVTRLKKHIDQAEAITKDQGPPSARGSQSLAITDTMLEKAAVVLDYYKLDLVQLLPEVKQSFQKAQRAGSAKKQDKASKRLKNILEDSKKQVIYNQIEFLQDLPIKKYEKFCEFVEKVKKQKPKSSLAKSAGEIEKSIKMCFDINQETQAEAGSDPLEESIILTPENMEEIVALNINVDDEQITLDIYFKIINKIFAALRYEMYKFIQKYWAQHGERILEEKKKPKAQEQDELNSSKSWNADEEDILIGQDEIMHMAECVDKPTIYKRALTLFGLDITKLCSGDVQLLMRKLDYVYMRKPPVRQEFLTYIAVLTKAQDQLLELIYHPLNKFIKLEENPLDSTDMAYGVPVEFTQIFDSINEYVNAEDKDEDDFEFVDMGPADQKVDVEPQQPIQTAQAIVYERNLSEEADENEQDALSPEHGSNSLLGSNSIDFDQIDKIHREYNSILEQRMFDDKRNTKLQRVKMYSMNENLQNRLRKNTVQVTFQTPIGGTVRENEDKHNNDDVTPGIYHNKGHRGRMGTFKMDARTNNILSPFQMIQEPSFRRKTHTKQQQLMEYNSLPV